MTLRKTAAMIIVLSMAVFAFVFWQMAETIMGAQFRKLESRAIFDDLHRLQESLDAMMQNNTKLAADYGHWSDTWTYLADQNQAYHDANLTWANLSNLSVDHFFFFDTNGTLVSHVGAAIHRKDGDTLPTPINLLHALDLHSPAFEQSRYASSSWIQVVDTTAWLLSSAGITDNIQPKGSPWRGYILMVRKLDWQMLANLQNKVRVGLTVYPGGAIPPTATSVDEQGSGLLSYSMFEGDLDPSTASKVGHSTGFLRTGLGNNLVFKLIRERDTEASGAQSMRFLYIGIVVSGLFLMLVLLVMIQKVIIGPLLELEHRFNRIGTSGDLAMRVPVKGPNELQNHSRAVNAMLDQLGETLRKLERSEQEQRALADELRNTHAFMTKLVDFLPDATFAVDSRGTVMAWNRSMEQLTGVPHEKIMGLRMEKVAELLYGMQRPLLMESFFHPELGTETFPERHELPGGMFQYEEFVANLDGNKGRFLDQTAIALRDGRGTFLGALQTIRDVSDQKKAEMRLEFLSLHDPLTGLYNRTYYSETSSGLSVPENLPMGTLLVDLDGLKLVNDTLGHEHGDALILASSGIFRKVFPDRAVSRIGGDEFVVIFPKTEEHVVRLAAEQLLAAVEDFNQGNPPMPVQMSVGWSWSHDQFSIPEMVKEADARMYREKDLRRESVRMGYVTNLQRRFEELHRKDQDATQRLSSLVQRFSKFMDCDEESQKRLELLARYRDIGKVGISERIMMKPGSLDEDEQAELKKQPEIGYRIAKISRELSPIADLILKHREWWDGRGYPLGISGEQIPRLNRLLAVVEAYVAMTGPRMRSRSISAVDAMDEIASMSGKKLDPSMVEAFGKFLSQG